MHEYYSKTDASVYTIATGMFKNLAFFYYKINRFLLVLDPRLKLEYMHDQEWEEELIETAKSQVRFRFEVIIDEYTI